MRRLAIALLLVATSASPAEADIHQTDWRAVTYPHVRRAPVDDDDMTAGYEIRDVVYGDLDRDGNDEAAVEVVQLTRGSAQISYVFVYALRDALTLLGELRGGDRAEGGLEVESIAGGFLYVRRAIRRADDALCCPSAARRERYRWRRTRLREDVAARTVVPAPE